MTYHWDSYCPGMAGDHVPCTCGDPKENKVILVQEPPTYRPSGLDPDAICERCGALIANQDAHSAWHVSLTAAIQHLADGLIGLFANQPGGKELIADWRQRIDAEVEAEQRQSSKEKEKET